MKKTIESKHTLHIECPFCSGLVEPKLGKMKCAYWNDIKDAMIDHMGKVGT